MAATAPECVSHACDGGTAQTSTHLGRHVHDGAARKESRLVETLLLQPNARHLLEAKLELVRQLIEHAKVLNVRVELRSLLARLVDLLFQQLSLSLGLFVFAPNQHLPDI